MHIFKEHSTGCLNLEQLIYYINYTLPTDDSDDLNLMTKHLLHCSLCSEALEGAFLFANNQPLQIDTITQQLQGIVFIPPTPLE